MMDNKKGMSAAAVISFIAMLALLTIFAYYVETTIVKSKQQPASIAIAPTPTQTQQLANPAAVHCKNLGGKTIIKTRADGSEYGICNIHGFECEEWALFRGECTSANDKRYLMPKPSPTNYTLPNPASANCVKLGGTVSTKTRGDGAEYRVCNFADGYACEEWALLRGDCKKPGVKTTGYDNLQQIYCVIQGGKTLAIPNARCTFNDGSVCDDLALYNGTCHKGKY